MNARATAVSRPTILLAAVAILALTAMYFVRPVLATQPDPLHKVTICHRTNSVTNPYVQIDVDASSVDGDADNDSGKGDHLLEHLGPVWDANTTYPTPHNGDQWGDIIPPFYDDGVTLTGFPSLNWDDAGQAIFNNDCNPAEQQSVAESDAASIPASVAESEAASVAESQAASVAESEPASVEQSVAESVAQSGEQSVEAGTGTPGESQPNTAMGSSGSNPLPTIAFGLILLASLMGLAFLNVKAARRIN